MKHLDLFSGIGGFALAASWVWGAEHEIYSFVEIEPFCQKVLKKHWPDVPIISDIRDVTYELLENTTSQRSGGKGGNAIHQGREAGEGGGEGIQEATGRENGIAISDNKPADSDGCTERTTIDLLTAGTPCQPASQAGKQRGSEDDRWLWPEAFRVVREFMPTWCIFENVKGLLTLEQGVEFENLLLELEDIGYETETYIIPACGVDAPHRRDRVWIVAHNGYANAPGWDSVTERQQRSEGRQAWGEPSSCCEDVADPISDTERSAHGRTGRERIGERQEPNERKWNEVGCNLTDSGEDVADTEGKQVHPEITEKNRAKLANRNKANLEEVIAGECDQQTGSLNPTWVEWLMNYPAGWTDLTDGNQNQTSQESQPESQTE